MGNSKLLPVENLRDMFVNMEPFRLTDTEKRVYDDLFTQCDFENIGKVSGVGAGNLFISSGLSQDVLNQITELCGAKRLGHFGRYQFYIALKLIAAAQAGLPVMLESLNSGQELPLPKFGVHQTNTEVRKLTRYNSQEDESRQNDRKLSIGTSIQPPPKHVRGHQVQRNSTSGHDGPAMEHKVISPTQSPPMSPQTDGTDIKQPNVGPAVLPNQLNLGSGVGQVPPNHINPGSGVGHMATSQLNPGPGSAHTSVSKMHPGVGPGHVPTNQMHSGSGSTATQVPANQLHPGVGTMLVAANQVPPTTGMAPGSMAPGVSPTAPQFEHIHGLDKAWASFEEDKQGLISSETKEWAHFTDSSSKHDTSSLSSEADSIEDVWSITDEQREYYINQFKTMQPDVRGVISGAVAKEFFEKSRLPVAQLSKIWQLSDVNRDGALSLEEFCTAMHLVVLRRNEIELPDHLPPALIPYVPLNPEEPFAADLPPGSTIKKISPTPPSPAPPAQWAGGYSHGPESPTSSSVSSPGSKPTPVNFDYKPIIADAESKIVHPVALRMSPDGHAVPFDEPDPVKGYDMDQPVVSPTGYHGDGTDDMTGQPLPAFIPGAIQGRPRPTPKKSQSVSGPTVDIMVPQPRLLPPPTSQDHLVTAGDRPLTLPGVGGTNEVAPLPPPRPRSGHSRSSSLDNQLIDFSDHKTDRMNQSMPPPAVPPRAANKEGLGFGDGSEMVAAASNDSMISVTPPGYQNDRSQSRNSSEPYTSTPAKYLTSQVSTEQKDLRDSIRAQRLKNMALSRLNNELNQELQEVMEQRIALEIQLEHLQPFHS